MTQLTTVEQLDQLPVGTVIGARDANGRPWEKVTGKPWRVRCIHSTDISHSLWVVDGAPIPFPEWSYALLKRAALAGVHHWVALNALLPLEDPERERR